jgi:hypothetical protein
MTQITQVRKNATVPTFEEVKNRYILVKRHCDVMPTIYLFTNYQDFKGFDFSRSIISWWTVLSDEQVVCEYGKDEVGFGWSVTGCGHRVRYSDTLEWNACPFCGITEDIAHFESHKEGCYLWLLRQFLVFNSFDKEEMMKAYNTRPIEDALQSALATAQEENKRMRKAIERLDELHWKDNFPLWIHNELLSALNGGK